MSTHDGGPAGPNGGPAGRAALPRLRLYRNPLRLAVSGSPWRAAAFLAAYVFVAGWLLFALAFTTTVTAAFFMITLAGIPLLVAASGVLRGCASAERARLRQGLAGPVRGRYPPVPPPGIMPQGRTPRRAPSPLRDPPYPPRPLPPLPPPAPPPP